MPWAPALNDSYPRREVLPPKQFLLTKKSFALQQRFWDEYWDNAIASSMLKFARDVIDIPATLAQAEEFYQAGFCRAGFISDSF